MKQYILLIALSLGLMACDQFKEVSDVDKVENIGAKIAINITASEGIPTPTSFKIKFNNYTEGFELVKEVNASSIATIDGLIPGIYTITVSGEAVGNGFTYNYNGNLVNTYVFENNKQYSIDVASSKSGNIILKEIYYPGSKTPTGGYYFRDQYYELYNNSNTVQYLDKLCFGNMLPLTATANLYTWDRENQDQYVYFATIWQIPGNGTEYPLQPGESVIIAQMGDNHQRAELNPACPVTLLSAEFETLVKTTALIKDNPAINLNIAAWPGKSIYLAQYLVTVFGGAYAIFYPEEEINPNTFVTPVNSTLKAKDIPIGWIVDAVELVNDDTKMKLKRVPAVLDAGATTVNGTYNGKSVSRNIKETLADGRIIYMDTNNSSEDFHINDTPVPRRNNAKIPSWNTWAK